MQLQTLSIFEAAFAKRSSKLLAFLKLCLLNATPVLLKKKKKKKKVDGTKAAFLKTRLQS